MAAGSLSRGHVFLLLAERDDAGAAEVARQLAARHGRRSVAVVSGADVVFTPGLTLQSGLNGCAAASAVALAARLAGGEPAAVLCRAYGAPAPWAARAKRRDAEYAADEGAALLLAWLASLPCRVVNAPSSPGLQGPSFTPAHWLGLAGRAGLPCAHLRMTTNARANPVAGWSARRPDGRAYGTRAVAPGPRPAHLTEPLNASIAEVLVAGEHVEGPLATHLHRAARRLAAGVGCGLLGLSVREGWEGQVVTAVEPAPSLMPLGHAAAAAGLMERLAAGRSA